MIHKESHESVVCVRLKDLMQAVEAERKPVEKSIRWLASMLLAESYVSLLKISPLIAFSRFQRKGLELMPSTATKRQSTPVRAHRQTDNSSIMSIPRLAINHGRGVQPTQ